MSRSKKARSGGNGDVVVVRNRTQSDVEGRLRKREKKRKGLKTGTRNSEEKAQKQRSAAQKLDPRLGSKKKIPLVVEAAKKPNKAERRVNAEKELEMLENDAQLNVLLDRLDNGESLGAGLQKYVDEKLERIEVLMKQLGLYEEPAEEEFEEEVVVEPTVKKASKKAATDDDLLSQFEDLDLNQFKG
ncbi:Der GTPase-activating protein YihI [Vibrio hepatarius]|jgi:ribosome assembly protein YihI (activator of Der GTPase)|uniref:Der GTPase-activating protein YihI n=1 Tax=Vibrio hepatarius TaxID=171383 RepID=A0A0M0HUU5_9VIBR|nr:Der GTPase-activating protein YihI [Vibrio hepatarius]KOO05642.1 aminotransferase [Vibrio hepatarius]NOI15962.1 GTPase-activating protein [Vibrio hepatarius]